MGKAGPENSIPSAARNETYYGKFWQWYSLDNPRKWPQWNLVKHFNPNENRILEVGAGLRPRIPIEKGYFVDLSYGSLRKLNRLAARSVLANFNEGLPFTGSMFDVVCAFEVLEHLDEDRKALEDVSRVLKPDGKALISFPLHSRLFNSYDMAVGHRRRYDVEEVTPLFLQSGLEIEQYAGQDVPWPKGVNARMLTILTQKLPWVIPVYIKIADSLPSSAVRRPMDLKPWDYVTAKADLDKVSTGFFILKKAQR